MSTQKRSDEDFARELALAPRARNRAADRGRPGPGRRPHRRAPRLRQRHGRARALLRSPARALARPPGAGRPLRRAQHAARAGGGPRRRRVARRRHRRHHRHADGPGRRLSQAAACSTTIPNSSRTCRSAARTAPMRRGSAPPAALYRTWRDTFGSSIAATTAQPGLRDLRVGDRTDTAPSRAVTPEFFALLGIRAAPRRNGARRDTRRRQRPARDPQLRGLATALRRALRRHRRKSSGSTTSRTRSPASCPSASGSPT